jgi:hypothetical protein
MGEQIVQECRGIILDETDNWKVIAFPYRKFFNWEEGHAAKIDMATARCMTKLDGSIMTLYYYDNNWHVSSSGMPDAAGEASPLAPGVTFADLFWKTWAELKYSLPHPSHNRCYMFEMMTVYNRIICIYPKADLVLHGVRDVATFQEYAPEKIAEKHNWRCIEFMPMNSIDGVAKMAATLDPMYGEGYVVVDGNFNRVKVKNPAYVALSHMKEGMSIRRMIEIVRTNEFSEFLSYFQEFAALHGQVKERYEKLVAEITETYANHKDIPVQKDFAIAVGKKPYCGVLFSLRRGEVASVKEALRETHIDKLAELLGLREMVRKEAKLIKDEANV